MELPKRPQSHVLEERSRRAVRAALPPEWVVRDIWEDYGADLYVEIYRDSTPTGYEFAIQIKATEQAQKGNSFSVRIPWKTVNFLMQRQAPAMIVGYDGNNEKVYYRWLREYVTALEYGRKKHRNSGSIVVSFPSESVLNLRMASKIVDYFEIAGVSTDRVQELLEALPNSGAAERYDILQELRFLRSPDGVLYLLSLLPLDLMLDNLDMVDVSDLATTAFLEACLSVPSLPSTMLFWGVVADIAGGEEHNFKDMTNRLFSAMLPRFLEMDPEKIASQSYDLFGYSAEAGINNFKEIIHDEQLDRLTKVLCKKLKPLRKTAARTPQARNLYAALYTVETVDTYIVYLLDTEMEELWRFYEAGREHLKATQPDSDEMLQHGRGYFEALNAVFGYNFGLQHESNEEDVQDLLTSMAVKKVDLFSKYVELKEYEELSDRKTWSEEQMLRFITSDMLTYHKMYWYGQALDWFGLPCFTRSFLYGNR